MKVYLLNYVVNDCNNINHSSIFTILKCKCVSLIFSIYYYLKHCITDYIITVVNSLSVLLILDDGRF